MKRNKKVKKPVPVEESTDGSDTEEIPSPQAMKKGNAVTRKTRNTKPVESSDSEDKSKPKLPVKNVKETLKKPVESSDCIQVAGTSHNSDSEEIPSILRKRKVRVKKANIPVPEDNSDTTVNSLLIPENLSQIGKKRMTSRASSTTAPSDNSDSEENPQKLEKKGKKVIKKERNTLNDSDSEQKPQKLMKKEKKEIKKEDMKKEKKDIKKEDIKKEYIKKEDIKNEDINNEEISSNHSDDSAQDDETINHMKDLDQLRRVDPEFYNYLHEHDARLLRFKDDDDELDSSDEDDGESDDTGSEQEDQVHVPSDLHGGSDESDFEDDNDLDSSDEDDGESDDSGSEQEDQVHVPSDLHGGSDESDFEAEGKTSKRGDVTLKMVHELENDLQKSKIDLGTITQAVKLFNAAVLRATSEDGTTKGEFKVAGSSVFNAVLNMCVVYLPTAIGKYLGFETSGKDPQKCKHFVKIKSSLIEYLSDLLKLLQAVSSDNILTTMLKHLHQLCQYVACFSRIAKNAIKKLLPLWSTGEETVRVLSFLCILRITRNHQKILLIPVLKAMFMAYIRNSKFVSPTAWPGINFMRRSLVEMFTLDLQCSYVYVFLYVRQLGIHLRNAIVVPKVENKLAVFNWQFMNALHLWAELVSQSLNNSGMKSLFFPLVMLISNTIKLGPTPEYYPVRFYLIELLMKMEQASGEFITIMPFFMDVITKFDINKKHKKASMKPLDLSCIIRLSKSQISESGFKDAVVERLYALLLEYTASLSYKIIFPDCCTVLILFFRELVDKCNNSNHKKKLKQLLDKIVENNDYMTKKRLTFDGHLAELKSIVAWEKQIKAQGTPLLTYYENWKKLNKIQKRKEITKNDELAVVLPLIKRPKFDDDVKPDTKESGPVNLFPSDSEDDNFFKGDEDEKVTLKKEVNKSMKVKKEVNKSMKVKKEVNKSMKVKKEKIAIKKEVTKKQKKKTPKKDSEASKSDELEVADTGDVVGEFSW